MGSQNKSYGRSTKEAIYKGLHNDSQGRRSS